MSYIHRPGYIAPLSFLQTYGASECCFAVRLNTSESPRWEEPPAVCCRLPGYLPSSPEVRLRLRIHHRGPPPVTHHVSRLSRRSHVRQLLLIEIPARILCSYLSYIYTRSIMSRHYNTSAFTRTSCRKNISYTYIHVYFACFARVFSGDVKSPIRQSTQ